MSLDEHSSSYASSHSSDSEDDVRDAEDKWDSARGPVHSTPKGEQHTAGVGCGTQAGTSPPGMARGAQHEAPYHQPGEPGNLGTSVLVTARDGVASGLGALGQWTFPILGLSFLTFWGLGPLLGATRRSTF